MLALSRFYRDSEMAVLSAFGVSRFDLYRPLIWLVVPGCVLLLILAMWVSPWALRTNKTMINDAKRDVSVAGLQAGKFHQIATNDGVVYVESISEDGVHFSNAFIHTERNDRKDVVTARSGYQYEDEISGARFLALFDGFRSEGIPGQADYRWMHFARNDIRLPVIEGDDDFVLKIGALTLAELEDRPANIQWAEWHWRLAPAMAALVLTLLAVPLSRSSPRQGYYGNLIVAILAYVIYANLLAVSKSWLEAGQLSGAIGLWWVHSLVILAAGLMLRNPLASKRRRVLATSS
jgi:lipopolysaccharide export system permease protein